MRIIKKDELENNNQVKVDLIVLTYELKKDLREYQSKTDSEKALIDKLSKLFRKNESDIVTELLNECDFEFQTSEDFPHNLTKFFENEIVSDKVNKMSFFINEQRGSRIEIHTSDFTTKFFYARKDLDINNVNEKDKIDIIQGVGVLGLLMDSFEAAENYKEISKKEENINLKIKFGKR